MTVKPIPIDDLIELECKAIATELIRQELEKQNLPMPRESSLDLHINALVSSRPEIRVQAERRVTARQDAYSIGLKALGIEVEPVAVVDIEL